MKTGELIKQIEELREVQRRYMELLRWFIEHSDEVAEIEKKRHK